MSKKYRSFVYFVLFSLGFLVLVYLGLLELDLPDLDFSFKKQLDYSYSSTWIEVLTWNLYVTPFDSFVNFEKSVLQTDDILYLQTYDFTEKRVKKIFKKLLDRGVKIRLIMENKKYKQYLDTFKMIENYFSWYEAFDLKSDEQMGTNYIHSKIALLDDEFWIQTANLTHSSFFENREHFFVSSNSGVYVSLKTVFDKDWDGEEILLSDLHPNLLVCNINCRIGIEELLSSAKKSVMIQTQYISDPGIRNILGQLLESGISLKIILADTFANDKNIQYFGPNIARILKKPYNHTKMILVDWEILLIGSMNLSENSLDNNREIGILTKDKTVIGKFLKQFENDWEKCIY